jgi:hypothetical protein
MKWFLFLMFFITPPGPKPPPGQGKVWTLQSTSTMEFATEEACTKVGGDIGSSLDETFTVTMRGWCFCEAKAPDKCPEPQVSQTDRRFAPEFSESPSTGTSVRSIPLRAPSNNE